MENFNKGNDWTQLAASLPGVYMQIVANNPFYQVTVTKNGWILLVSSNLRLYIDRLDGLGF